MDVLSASLVAVRFFVAAGHSDAHCPSETRGYCDIAFLRSFLASDPFTELDDDTAPIRNASKANVCGILWIFKILLF